MKIIDKIISKRDNNNGNPAVTIAFMGDSVTQGCFEIYKTGEKTFTTVFDSENGYIYKVKKILSYLYPQVAFNIINAGLNGTTTNVGITRIDRDVLRYSPDLVVVCFGLNDCHWGVDKICDFEKNLDTIFSAILASGAEIIYMTPNMMNTEVSCRIDDPMFADMAKTVMEVQNSGTLEKFQNAAKALCHKYNIPVCDCYSKWKMLEKNGVDTTALLANNINHPTREMHWLFATELVQTMMNKE